MTLMLQFNDFMNWWICGTVILGWGGEGGWREWFLGKVIDFLQNTSWKIKFVNSIGGVINAVQIVYKTQSW